MAWIVPLVLLAWPAAEIAVFIKVSQWVGLLGAVLGIVLSGMAGLALLQRQSFGTAQNARSMMNKGQMPVVELFDAACLAVAGMLLLLPGYITSAIALLLLLPPVRLGLRLWIGALVLRRAVEAGVARPETAARAGVDPSVIDGEWSVVETSDAKPSNPENPPQIPHS